MRYECIHAPVDQVTSCSRDATEREYSFASTNNSHTFEKQQKFGVLRFQHRKSLRNTPAFLLSMLAIASLLVGCLRAARTGTLTSRMSRSLAGGLPENEKKFEESALLNACLDLQKEAGTIQQASGLLASPEQGLSRILATISDYAQESTSPRSGSAKHSTSEEQTSRSPSPQPGPSHEYAGQQEDISDIGRKNQATPRKRSCEKEALKEHAKDYTSGWKRRKPAQSPQGSSPIETQPETPAAEAQAEEPFSTQEPFVTQIEELSAVPSLDLSETIASEGFFFQDGGGREERDYLPLAAVEAGLAEGDTAQPTTLFLSTLSAAESTNFVACTDSASSASDSVAGMLMATVGESLPETSKAASAAPLPADNLNGAPWPEIFGVVQGAAPPMPPCTHPYYRLPVVLPYRNMKTFNADFAFSEVNMRSHAFLNLAQVRALLAQPQLTASDVENVITNCEVIAGRLFNDLQLPRGMESPGAAVAYLGSLYVYMEALLCAIQVIGPPMNASAWWPQLAAKVPPERVFASRRPGKEELGARAALATQLSAALQLLKKGIRLGEKETVEIKRAIFCSEYAVVQFKHRRWDPWRDDDEESKSSAVQ